MPPPRAARFSAAAACAALAAACYFILPSPPQPMPPPAALALLGRTAVVFGGTSGIGRGIALRLGELGASVTVVGRDTARGEAVVAALRASSPAPASHRFAPCDAFSLAAIRDTAAALHPPSSPPLDLLVLSQGMATLQGFTPTPEGLDQKLALHAWGRVAATRALLPALRRAPSPVVLSVLSAGVHGAFPAWREDLELSGAGSYGLKAAADAAGLVNDVAAEAQAGERGNERVLFLHAAPGFVNTAWGTELPWWARGLVRALQPLGRSPAQCADFLLRPVLARREGSGGGGFGLVGERGEAVAPSAGRGAGQEGTVEGVWGKTRGVVERVLGREFWAGSEAPPQ